MRKMVVVPKCANVCTGTYSLRKRECRAAGIMSRGACVREWVVGVKPSAVRYAGVTGSDRQPLV